MIVYRDGMEEVSDGPTVVSTTRDGHTVESWTVDGRPTFFVTLAGSHHCAHGSTLAEAIADAVWKDEKRRPSLETLRAAIQKDGPERKISLNEFRVLTGACRAGCKVELKRAGLDGSPMTAQAIKKCFPEWGAKLIAILDDEPSDD